MIKPQAPSLQSIEDQLRSHDWYYHYSDDYGVWLSGERAWQSLIDLCRQVPSADLLPLWKKHAPQDFQNMFQGLFEQTNK